MSYVVSIRRTIQKQEFLALIQNEPGFRINSQNEDCAVVEWTESNTNNTLFVLSQGCIDVTTPSVVAFTKLEEIAKKLNAEVIGEEDKFIVPQRSVRQLVGGSTWIGWPVLVIVLAGLLIWRW
jgi:hypothetical protein